MIHEIPIKWHDLIEDPTDLPKEKCWCWVICMNAETKDIDTCLYVDDSRLAFIPDAKCWLYEDYEDGHDAVHPSYGLLPNFDAHDFRYIEDYYDDKWVVIAWAEDPEFYRLGTIISTPDMEPTKERSDQN